MIESPCEGISARDVTFGGPAETDKHRSAK